MKKSYVFVNGLCGIFCPDEGAVVGYGN
ncbi:DUF6783 domain-containing protein [Blautia wexlerae]